ncbi:uncharacterized protein [Nicotiana sylvestris]|uniref:uncharacterized protein n=1 Tax=Nicotiana sylvestris TaxID=4096 RepID=UPI00388C493B
MFSAFVRKTQKQLGNQLASIRSDHGTEFENAKFAEFCDENGIYHNFYAPRTPQQNGVVERKNMTLEDMARTMLLSSKLPQSFWPEAVNTTCYIINRCMTKPLVEKIPYELLKGRKPNISHLRAFGCKFFVHNNGKDSLVFDETNILSERQEHEDEAIGLVKDLTEALAQVKVAPKEGTGDGTGSSIQGNLTEGTSQRGIEINPLKKLVHDPVPQQQNMGEVSSRNQLVVKPHKYQSSHLIENIIADPTFRVKNRSQLKNLCAFDAFLHLIEPKNIVEALQDADWVNAMQDGLNQFERSQVWHLVPRPKDRSIIDIDEPGSSVDQKLYRGIIGLLLYLTASRPDIVFSVGFCARFQANPKESPLTDVKRILRYLKGTTDLCLWYPKGSNFNLEGYADADYIGLLVDRKNTSVALFTAEAEYVAAASCCAQLLWIKQQLVDFGIDVGCIPILCDNNSAISMFKRVLNEETGSSVWGHMKVQGSQIDHSKSRISG